MQDGINVVIDDRLSSLSVKTMRGDGLVHLDNVDFLVHDAKCGFDIRFPIATCQIHETIPSSAFAYLKSEGNGVRGNVG